MGIEFELWFAGFACMVRSDLFEFDCVIYWRVFVTIIGIEVPKNPVFDQRILTLVYMNQQEMGSLPNLRVLEEMESVFVSKKSDY